MDKKVSLQSLYTKLPQAIQWSLITWLKWQPKIKKHRIPSTPIELVLIHWFSQSFASCQSIWTPDVWQHSESECKTSNVFTLAPDSVMFLYEADSISPARQIKSYCSGYVTSEPLSDTAGKDRQWLHHKLPPDVSVLPLVPYSIKDNYRAASDLMGIITASNLETLSGLK